MNKDILRQVINVITLIATLAVNALANILPFNGITTGEISDSFKVYFVPAGYVFSIWSLIYVLLAGFAVYQALPAQRTNPRLRRIGYGFAAANILNGAWMFAWHYAQFPLSLVIMLALLVTLIVIYIRLEIGRSPAAGVEKWLVNLPFSIYLGWITVATVANATDVLDFVGWTGFGLDPRIWAAVMLAVASLVGLLVALTRRDAAYLLVLVWAFIGIGVKFPGIAYVEPAAWAAAAAVGVMALWSLAAPWVAPRRVLNP